MLNDMEILQRAHGREKDPRNQRSRVVGWQHYSVGATAADIKRLFEGGLVEVVIKDRGITTYRLTEKGQGLVAVDVYEQEAARIPAATVLEAMHLVVGWDDLKEAISFAVAARSRTHFMLEGPPASIHGDTAVWVDIGSGPQSLPIAELQGKIFTALAVHPETLKSGWYQAEVTPHEYEGEWTEITGVGVKPFSVTSTHSLVAYDPLTGCLIPKRAGNLRKGELIPLLASWEPASMQKVTLNGEALKLDGEMGFVIGFWLGDGGLSQGKTPFITFTNYKREVLERIKAYLAGLERPGRYYRGGHLCKKDLRLQHKPLFELLKRDFLAGEGEPGIKGRTARWKKLPGWVFSAPDLFIRELLNGYFYADGTVANGVISATTTSPSLARDIPMLLTRLGICPGIQRRGKDAQAIVIRQCDAAAFMDKVGVFRGDKNVSTSVIMHDESFKVPFPFNDQMAASLTASLRKGRQSQSLTRRAAQDLLATPWPSQIVKLLNGHVRWVRVEHVRPWQEPKQTVYDLSVPQAETFVLGNRVLVHNCAKSVMLEGVRAAVPDAYIAFGSRTSASGLSDALFEKQPSVLLLDECDKMHNDCYSVMLGLMESGEVLETKSRKTRGIRLNTTVLAACNSSHRMPQEFLSRFALHAVFPEYTRDQFIAVCRGFLTVEGCPPEMASSIGQRVYDYGLGDVRKARGVWQMMREATSDEAQRVVNLMMTYSGDGNGRGRRSEAPTARMEGM